MVGVRQGVPTLNMSTKVCAAEWSWSAAGRRLQHTGDHSRGLNPPPFSFYCFFFYFFILFHYFLLFILPYTLPLHIESITGQQETGAKTIAPLVCVYTGRTSQYLAAWLTSLFAKCIYLRAVDGVMQHLWFPFTSCHFLFTSVHSHPPGDVI